MKKRFTKKDPKCHKKCNDVIPKNIESLSSNTSHTDKGLSLSDHPEVPRSQMPDIITEIATKSCTHDAKDQVTSRSDSFASNASNFLSSDSQVLDHFVKPNEEMVWTDPDIYLEDTDKLDIMDSEFDLRSMLEELDYFEAKQEKQLEAFLLSSNVVDEKYIMNHDLELAARSEWYRYLKNSELGLVGIIGEEDQKQ